MENVNALVKSIREGLTQQNSSQKDEVAVMRAMLNDREYQVGVYGKEGQIGTFCPASEAREMAASVIAGAAKIATAEARQLADEYDFTKSDAQNMVNISKEYVNTYLQTGRKLPLGGRETSDVSLMQKNVEATQRTYPKQVGVDQDGNKVYEKATTEVKAHTTIKAQGSCPSWIK